YVAAKQQNVAVAAGQEAEVDVQDQPAPTATPTETPEPNTGSIAIRKVDENGKPLAGACFTVTGPSSAGPVCDNGTGDGDPAKDGFLSGGLIPGPYPVRETTPPPGYPAAADKTVTVAAGNKPATVEFADQPTPPQTGNVRIISTAQGGGPAGAGCYTVGST